MNVHSIVKLLRVIVLSKQISLVEPRMNKNPWEEGPLDSIIAAGYDPVPVDDKLLPSHKDEKVEWDQSFQLDIHSTLFLEF